MARYLIGADTGGTFTDFVRVGPDGVTTWKVPSTPGDFARAVLAGLDRLLEGRAVDGAGADGDDEVELVHSSTVGTNALLERKGARVALVTTRGFADALAIGRQDRPSLYDFSARRPAPLVPAERRLEVAERVAADGTVLESLSGEAVAAVLDAALSAGAESLAVCLLFSFVAPAHERRIAAAARERGLDVSVSSEVAPEFREYERSVTTVVDAYVGPVVARYVERLAGGAAERGVRRVRVFQSNGGSLGAGEIRARAVRTLLSGPAAGVVGALAAARAALGERPRLLTLDMGGTSTDVALVDGEARLATTTEVGGWPIQVPMIDIHTVGAGGGSIARLDAGGALLVGPDSAGAEPGPACYGAGGPPTVTDAHVVLGRIDPDRFLGGRRPLDANAARRAIGTLAERAGTSLEDAARAVVDVVDAAMERALRVISVERGHDPADFALVAFGGAGGLHACALADGLGVPRVVVPPAPGVLSAWGAAAADVVRDYARTVMLPLDADGHARAASTLAELAAAARAEFRDEPAGGTAPDEPRLFPAADLRYAGQSYEIEVPWNGDPAGLREAFHAAHGRRYGHAAEDQPVAIVTLRLRAVRSAEPPAWDPLPADRPGVAQAIVAEPEAGPVIDRQRLAAGDSLAGPALLVEPYATTWLPAGWRAEVCVLGHLLAERAGPPAAGPREAVS